jgi:hypothetical protein
MSKSSSLDGSSSSSFSLSLLLHSSLVFTLVALAMKHVNGVSKREGFSLIAMLARAFFLVVLSSSLSSSSLEEASLS